VFVINQFVEKGQLIPALVVDGRGVVEGEGVVGNRAKPSCVRGFMD